MSDTIRCPDCGLDNAAGSDSCSACNFPLPGPESALSAGEKERSRPEPDPPRAGEEGHAESAPPIRPTRPLRPRRPRPQSGLQLQLWLMFSIVAAAAVIFIAVRANYDRASQPVEGSNQDQQKRAGEFQAALERDSTDVEAHIGLGNVLYDTGNWSDAIIHYRAVVTRDSSRVTALVDLGVCYYNLADAEDAERLFRLALARDPHQPIALFNLGIVNEQNGNKTEAMRFFHQALQSDPPEEMKKAVMAAMERLGKASGMQAPPLPQPPGATTGP